VYRRALVAAFNMAISKNFMKNHFTTLSAAVRYAIGRPYFHENTIERIQAFLKLDTKLNVALDVACGTGLSTKALLKIADHVYGTDSSQEMLHLAALSDKIHYTLATAENQPFNNATFDLITVSSGVHWFSIDAFLTEANRLLKPAGWLVLYENLFWEKCLDKHLILKIG
jgi:ubiquinone/menaquinone biosynthesis C-methylase UbiE